ncbi:MAG: hypothetical protein CMA59_05300 [Euryarchaeota archaeon]|jgi:hypothetical protein|nr:hypothetical protein [Euryarchaeota archaeon]|tara:strand:- start:1051 stop:1572 length:522 start_codon:yes stop_codon:yes gene_type:complete
MSGVEIEIQTQSFRVTPSEPVNLADAVKYAGARSNGAFGVIEHEEPRALIVVDTDGSLLIHGISNFEVASLIAEETLLSIGLSEKGLVVESGEVLASFSVGRAVLIGLAAERFEDANHDLRLDALRIAAKRHNCTILLFNNGRGIVMGQPSRKVAEMAVSHWISQLSQEGALA